MELEIIVVGGRFNRWNGPHRPRFGRTSAPLLPAGTNGDRSCRVLVARGDLISFLDADDVWLANKLCRQIASLKQGERDMIFTQIEELISPDRICILIYERFRASDWPISP